MKKGKGPHTNQRGIAKTGNQSSKSLKLRAANDNLTVVDDFPKIFSVTETEVDILVTSIGDLIKSMIAANDN